MYQGLSALAVVVLTLRKINAAIPGHTGTQLLSWGMAELAEEAWTWAGNILVHISLLPLKLRASVSLT